MYSIASPILLLGRTFRYVSFIHVSKSRIVGYDIFRRCSNLIEAASNPFNHRIRLTIFSILRPSPSSTYRNHPKPHMLSDKTTPNTNAPCQCLQNAPSQSEAQNPQTAPIKRFNKKTAKKPQKPDSLTTSSLHRQTSEPHSPPNFHAED